MNENKYMEKCLHEIEDTVQWGKLNDWTGHNFDLLSDEISEKTGIKLSGRTLRRLVNHKISNPQIATKNALTKFLGYKNWEEFVVQHSNGNNKKPVIQQQKQFSRFTKFVVQYFWAILLVVILTLSSFFIFFYPTIELELNKSRVEFRSNNLVGKAPHTATFFYDVSKIKSSNILVDNNYYNESSIVPLKKNMHFYSNTFELPDYYAVKIIANGERMSCVRVHVVTDGWEYVAGGKHFTELPRDSTNDWLYINPVTLKNNSIIGDSVYYIEYRNIRNFEAIGDQMTYETRFKNNADLGGIGCFDSKIEVVNLHGRLSFNFLEPGCDQKRLRAEFGDVALSGEFNNLNTFFQDVSYWRVLKIVTKKKNVSVFLDDVQIYSVKYNDPLHQVKGLTFRFKGAGAVDYVKLFNENDELVYEDNFNLVNQ